MAKTTAVIVGATGAVGRKLTPLLAGSGQYAKVVILHRRPTPEFQRVDRDILVALGRGPRCTRPRGRRLARRQLEKRLSQNQGRDGRRRRRGATPLSRSLTKSRKPGAATPRGIANF